jgi:hypothetical protein
MNSHSDSLRVDATKLVGAPTDGDTDGVSVPSIFILTSLDARYVTSLSY